MSVRIDDFSILLLVDATRSFSGAAESRSTTQQSISTRIRKLEGQLGLSLFERTNHGVRLTPAGRRLLPYARRWVSLYEETLAAARSGSAIDSLRVCAQEAVKPMLEALPFELDYVDVSGSDLLAQVDDGTLDLAVGIFQEAPSQLVLEEVMTESLVLVVASQHPLAGRPGLAVDDLRGHPILLSMWSEGTSRSPVSRGANDEAIVAVPSSAVVEELHTGALVEVAVAGVPAWTVQVQAAHRRDDPDLETISLAISALSGAFVEPS